MLTRRNALINGSNLVWDEVGSGPSVLLIHGFPLCRTLWRPQVAALTAAGYHVIAPDLRGFGESDTDSGIATIGRYVDDLVELLDLLEVEKTVAVGMSMGGYLLFDLQKRFTDRLSAAVFAVTRCLPDDEAGKQRRYQLAKAVQLHGPQAVADPFLDLLVSATLRESRPKLAEEVYSWMISTSTQGLVSGLLAMADRPDATEQLADIQIPSLVIGAADDLAIPPEHSEMISAGIKGSELVIIPTAGHLANLESPTEFNRGLLLFLRKVAPTPLNIDGVLCNC